MRDTTKRQLEDRLAPFPPHIRTVLAGAFASYAEGSNPLRFTNTANALRELLRELFEELAPDERVKRCRWFTPDPEYDGVTRAHRAKYAVYSYIAPAVFAESFVTSVDDLAKEISANARKLNAFTHVSRKSLAKTEAQASAVFDNSLSLFLRLFEAIAASREQVRGELESILSVDLASLFTSEFFDDLDTLSTHTRVQDAEDIRIELSEIGEKKITFRGSGIVGCDLQYGSDGDCRRGDGVEWSDSFKFGFTGHADTVDPHKPVVAPSDIVIDTDKYRDFDHADQV